jgi:hypothetical protein
MTMMALSRSFFTCIAPGAKGRKQKAKSRNPGGAARAGSDFCFLLFAF